MMNELFKEVLWEEDEEDQPSELRPILQYSSATGKLYVATDECTIRSADVRQQLLSGKWAPSSSAPSACPSPAVSTLLPLPDLDLTTSSFSLSRSGTHATAGGPTLADPELSALFVLDLTSCRSRNPRGSGGSKTGTEEDVRQAPATPLDPDLFSTHPGLRILQATWHPNSDSHVAVLTSDATWRLYDIHRPDLAEQTFELRGGGGAGGLALGLDVERPAGAAPMAFCFGEGPGWDRFAVYFLFADGTLWTLCPVAPFGARYAAHILDTLHQQMAAQEEEQRADQQAAAGEAEDGNALVTSLAWLQRAFQPVSSLLSAEASADVQVPDLLACCAHALDEHSPALTGPLPVASVSGVDPQPPSSLLPSPVEGLLMWRVAGAVTAVALGSAKGRLALHVLAGDAAPPRWKVAPPQCVAEGGELRAVRCQAGGAPGSVVSESQQQLVLIDIVALPRSKAAEERTGRSSSSSGGDATTSGSRQLALCRDLSSPDTLYCVQPTQAHAVALPWLPLLAGHMAGGGAPLPDALPSATIEELCAGAIAAAVAVGDALCGSGLVILRTDGSYCCERPTTRCTDTADAGDAKASTAADGQAAADVEARIQRTYGEILRGPQAAAPPAAAGGSGARALMAATGALRSSHIEFAHKAHHGLAERLEQLRREVQSQEEREVRVAALAATVEAGNAAVESAVARAAWMADNLRRRLHLLAELHWALPRPASVAETAFKREELPELEAAARQMDEETAAVAARVAALQHKQQRSGGGVIAAKAGTAVSVPPSQLRQVRELLAEHDRAIRAAQQQAAALRSSVAAA